jgi:hypothetical protein
MASRSWAWTSRRSVESARESAGFQFVFDRGCFQTFDVEEIGVRYRVHVCACSKWHARDRIHILGAMTAPAPSPDADRVDSPCSSHDGPSVPLMFVRSHLGLHRLFWSRRGDVACGLHAPHPLGHRWRVEQWVMLEQERRGRQYCCQHCHGSPLVRADVSIRRRPPGRVLPLAPSTRRFDAGVWRARSHCDAIQHLPRSQHLLRSHIGHRQHSTRRHG